LFISNKEKKFNYSYNEAGRIQQMGCKIKKYNNMIQINGDLILLYRKKTIIYFNLWISYDLID
jgi:hypothetical protein